MTSDAPNERRVLVPHPASQAGAVRGLTVEIEKPSPTGLTLVYRLDGEIPALRIPEPREPVRTDGLWRHTCFEAFIGSADGRGYWEYNFSPSGAWAIYHFSGYREAMEAMLKGAPPVISVDATADKFVLTAVVDLAWLARAGASGLRLGVTAVIEDRARVLSYWALKHPTEKPDFHHADGFVVPLD
jgi:hypothetical protein